MTNNNLKKSVKLLDRPNESALLVARYLINQKNVSEVLYPGLQHEANSESNVNKSHSGFGTVVSFALRKTDFRNVKKFVEVLRNNSPVIYGESLGISDGFFRLSVGPEDPTEIIIGLKIALGNI